jgi:heme/copper-type cytochrome/quinol oxidase subunit 2
LLKADTDVILPVKEEIRVLITSSDVIHSWSIPALGIKLDACPGRLNQVGLSIDQVGTYYGMCSELCGINHAFMPINVSGVPAEVFSASISK